MASSSATAPAPETHLKRGPTERGIRPVVAFAFVSDQGGASFECELDRDPFHHCASPFESRVRPGRHTFRVRAVNALGMADPTPAMIHWTADR